MSIDLLTFPEALDTAGSIHPTKHLLLGNGFSRACRDDLFSYDTLIKQADLSGLSFDAWEGFDLLGTSDFEVLMRALRQAAWLLQLYGADAAIRTRLEQDSEALKNILVDAIAQSHPDHPFEISDDEYSACRDFLRPFKRIYSLNYDLLLYWAGMRTDIGEAITFDDGFRAPEGEDEVDYVVWEPANTKRQNIFYLHGGLHIFDGGSETKKYTWSRTGVRLIDQVRVAMDSGLFPVFVSEGDSETKLSRIRHHGYLSKGERSLVELGCNLFIFGFAMSNNDAHIHRFLSQNSVKGLFVSLFGDPDSPANAPIISRALELKEGRRNPADLSVYFYDAASAKVWG